MAAAIDVLAEMEARHRPVADALKEWGLSHRFAGSGDRAAIGNIVYDVLRRKRSLAFRMDGETPHALVFGAVLDTTGMSPQEIAGQLDGDRFAPERMRTEALEQFVACDPSVASDAVRADVPDWLAPHFEAAFGTSWAMEAAALSDRPPLDLRVNTLRASLASVAKALEPLGAVPADLSPAGLRIPPIKGAGRHPNVTVEAGFQKGWFEVQDEGSQLVSLLSGARPGEQVLDLCAGGGGKTLALAAMMENTGQVHATDSDRQRLAPIHDRLKRAEVRNVQIHDPRDDVSSLDGAMDLVLVDAPCTGTGTWRRRPDAKWRLSERQLDKRVSEQDAVLDQAARFVKPGGRLAYITCSLLPAENADRIAAFLERHADAFAVADARETWHAALPGAPDAFCVGPVGGGQALTLTPKTTGTDGFFFCQMVRR